jgi:large subunit ribosomal protein L15
MQLHELKTNYKLKKEKRIGRGGKRGTYSGRGIKGQKSRAGHRLRPAERDLIQRLPKLRGFKNKPIGPKPIVINIKDLEHKLRGGQVTRQTLLEAGLIRKTDKRIKILAEGKPNRPFQIEGLEMSKSAKDKIKAAGGSVK